MADNQPDDTLIKILEEDRKGFHKKRGFGSLLVRLLIIAVLIFVGLYGFILFRQYRLNLEAEAIVFAKRTAQSIRVQKSQQSPRCPQKLQKHQYLI